MGAGITAAATVAGNIVTSVNQCWQKGAVTIQAAGGALATLPTVPERSLSAPRWIHHDRVGYVFPALAAAPPTDSPAAVVVKAEAQSGKWTDLKADAPDKRTLTGEVFSIWLDHGQHPADARYAYVVVPGIAPGEMPSYQSDLPVTILANTASVQAVWHRGLRLLQAGFYETGAVSAPGKWDVAVSHPCVVLVREDRAGQMVVSVANPRHTPLKGWNPRTERFVLEGDTPAPPVTVAVTLTRPGLAPVRTDFVLPTGAYAGQTVTKTISLI